VGVLYIIGGLVLFGFASALIDALKQRRINNQEWMQFQVDRNELELREGRLATAQKLFDRLKIQSTDTLERIAAEKSQGFPWLASAYSDYFKLVDLEFAALLEAKKHPAVRAADELRRIAAEKAELRKENKVLRELHAYYQYLFPWLSEFVGSNLDELIQQAQQPTETGDEEPALRWLTAAEQESSTITRAEKFQRALDRYWKTRKTPWQIGRDYERYIGYLHEKEGFKVSYFGIARGLEDLGRDLICSRENEVRVIQCKYWASGRTLHEKHICQVYGTAAAYAFRNNAASHSENVSGWLYSSCSCSEVARQFADLLRVEIRESVPLAQYPSIKCNVSATGEKIYHLPFDQQYDRTLIERPDECYVGTVAEAEARGFRRAFRWRGTQSLLSS
jgi:hypothetical protein